MNASTHLVNKLTFFGKQLERVAAFDAALSVAEKAHSDANRLIFEEVGIPLQESEHLNALMAEIIREIQSARSNPEAIAALSDFAGRVLCAGLLMQ